MMTRWHEKIEQNKLMKKDEGRFAKVKYLLTRLGTFIKLTTNPVNIFIEILLMLTTGLVFTSTWFHLLLFMTASVTCIFGTQKALFEVIKYQVRKALFKANLECSSADLSDQIEVLRLLDGYESLFRIHSCGIGNTQWKEDCSIEMSKAAEDVIIKYCSLPEPDKFSTSNLKHYIFMTRVVPALYTNNQLSEQSEFANSIHTSAGDNKYRSIQKFFRRNNSKLQSLPLQKESEVNDSNATMSIMPNSKLFKLHFLISRINLRLLQLIIYLLLTIPILNLIIYGAHIRTSLAEYILFSCAVIFIITGLLLTLGIIIKSFMSKSRISQIVMKYALTNQESKLGVLLEQVDNHKEYVNYPLLDHLKSSTIMLLAQLTDESTINLTHSQRRILERMLAKDRYVSSISYPKMSNFTMVTSDGPLKLTHYAAHALGYLGDKSSLAVLKRIVKRTKDITLQQIGSAAIERLDQKLKVSDSYLLRSSQISNCTRDLLSISMPQGDSDEEKQTLNNQTIEP